MTGLRNFVARPWWRRGTLLWLSAAAIWWAPGPLCFQARSNAAQAPAGQTRASRSPTLCRASPGEEVPLWWCEAEGIQRQVEAHFDETMQNPNVKLFSDRNLYLASLPRRQKRDGSVLLLYTLPFYAWEQDLKLLAEGLVEMEGYSSNGIRYVASPAMSGKSSCILPAFLYGVERLKDAPQHLTHYVYVPFASNNGKWHRGIAAEKLAEWDISAETAGERYMIACLEKQLLDLSYMQDSEVGPSLSGDNSRTRLEDLLDKVLMSCPKGCVLIHLDEQEAVCRDADFRRGALELLASFPSKLKVVLTTTDIPPLPSARTSSEAGRIPLTKPVIAVARLMRVDERFRIQISPAIPEEVQRGRLQALRVLLGLVLEKLGLETLHGTPSDAMARFLVAFKAAQADPASSLENCRQVCQLTWMGAGSGFDLAQLFQSMEEEDEDEEEEQDE